MDPISTASPSRPSTLVSAGVSAGGPSPGTSPDVVGVETTPRPTAPTVGVPFSEVLAGGARTLARTAGAAVHSLPGSPIMAVALRGTGGISTALSTSGLQGPAPGLGGVNIYGPGGPSPVAGTATGSTSGTAADGSAAGTNDPSISSALAQDQEMNLYYLQIQEQVNAQNRTYSALSNVIEVEHNTAKTAIGNIH